MCDVYNQQHDAADCYRARPLLGLLPGAIDLARCFDCRDPILAPRAEYLAIIDRGHGPPYRLAILCPACHGRARRTYDPQATVQLTIGAIYDVK